MGLHLVFALGALSGAGVTLMFWLSWTVKLLREETAKPVTEFQESHPWDIPEIPNTPLPQWRCINAR